jgi:hypothetical protein
MVALSSLCALAADEKQPAAPAKAKPDRQVDLIFTVNNLGYLDTCG